MKVKYRMIGHGAVLACLALITMMFPVTPTSAAFSGQNGSIAFESNRDDVVKSMAANGSAPTWLTINPDRDFEAAFSLDGSKIAFSSGRDGNDEIYVMNVDGSGETLDQHAVTMSFDSLAR
jgi:Tol biopolymer transport system component